MHSVNNQHTLLITGSVSGAIGAATSGGGGRRNLTLTIEPAWVRRGQSALLRCEYELSGAPLYSVKWYRGTLEFYRYSPLENPPAKIFPFTGIKVDVSRIRQRIAEKQTLQLIVKFNVNGDACDETRVNNASVSGPFGDPQQMLPPQPQPQPQTNV